MHFNLEQTTKTGYRFAEGEGNFAGKRMNAGPIAGGERKLGINDAINDSLSSQAMARPERREGLGVYESGSHHFSCSIGLPALRSWEEARGVVTLTSSDLHAEALTWGVGRAAASGAWCTVSWCTVSFVASEVPLVRAGSALVDGTASPSAVSAVGADSVAVEVGSVCVSSDLTALLGLRKRPPSF